MVIGVDPERFAARGSLLRLFPINKTMVTVCRETYHRDGEGKGIAF